MMSLLLLLLVVCLLSDPAVQGGHLETTSRMEAATHAGGDLEYLRDVESRS